MELCSWISAWEWRLCQSAIKIWLCVDICIRKCWRRFESESDDSTHSLPWDDSTHSLPCVARNFQVFACCWYSTHLLKENNFQREDCWGEKSMTGEWMLWTKYLISGTAGSFLWRQCIGHHTGVTTIWNYSGSEVLHKKLRGYRLWLWWKSDTQSSLSQYKCVVFDLRIWDRRCPRVDGWRLTFEKNFMANEIVSMV